MGVPYVPTAEDWAEFAADMEAIAIAEQARRAADVASLAALDQWVEEQGWAMADADRQAA